jgi:hypothetical protein
VIKALFKFQRLALLFSPFPAVHRLVSIREICEIRGCLALVEAPLRWVHPCLKCFATAWFRLTRNHAEEDDPKPNREAADLEESGL